MEAMRDAALYGVSRWSEIVQSELSTLAMLPLARANANIVSSTSGEAQQLGKERKISVNSSML